MMTRRRWLKQLAAAGGGLLATVHGPVLAQVSARPASPNQANVPIAPLVFGVYPYLSPTQMVSQFVPLADHLAQSLGRPVELRSAHTFGAFIERTRAGEYDLIFTAPHMGRLAEQRDGYRPVAQTGYRIVIVALARQDGPVKTLADLNQRSLAVGAQLSMTYQIIDQALAKHGLTLGREVKFIDTASFSNVTEAIMRGEADAGATGTLLWETAPPAQRAALREIYRSEAVPGFLVLAHPRHGTDFARQATQSLRSFATTAAGKAYFKASHQIDFRPLDAATMLRLDPFTKVFDTP